MEKEMTVREKFEYYAGLPDAAFESAFSGKQILRDICEWVVKQESRREQVSGQPAGTRTS